MFSLTTFLLSHSWAFKLEIHLMISYCLSFTKKTVFKNNPNTDVKTRWTILKRFNYNKNNTEIPYFLTDNFIPIFLIKRIF